MKSLKVGLVILIAVLAADGVWTFFPEKESRQLHAQIQHAAMIEASPLRSDSPVLPIPLTISVNAKKVLLGKKLFNEPRLSRDNSVSCASCHSLSTAGMDNTYRSTGVGKVKTEMNTPTVFNSSLQFRQFWNGRALTLEEQSMSVISTHGLMQSDWPIAITKLRTNGNYAKDFAEIYADGITPQNVADVIAEFERTLLTPNARFDKYLRGDEAAINALEKQGYDAFKRNGCITCHQGVLLGGNMFERMGSVRDYFTDRGNINSSDLGYFNVTHQEIHRYYFKVASLRNVDKTAPYFHDGSAATLKDAVIVMAKYNLGINISNEDVASIVAFLRTLTGEYQGKPL